KSATGTRIGRRRAVSRETKRARPTSPDALSEERTGRRFTVARYQFAVLPGPTFQVRKKSGQEGSHYSNVRKLYLPMQHSVLSRVGRLGRAKYPWHRVMPTSPLRVIRVLAP